MQERATELNKKQENRMKRAGLSRLQIGNQIILII